MKNMLGILLISLILGMAVIGCDDGSINCLCHDESFSIVDPDPALNGTWVYGADDFEIRFTNGYWEEFDYNGEPFFKGTYSTTVGMLTLQMTHVFLYFNDNIQSYSWNQYIDYLRERGDTEEQISENVSFRFDPRPIEYYISHSPHWLVGRTGLIMSSYYWHKLPLTLTRKE